MLHGELYIPHGHLHASSARFHVFICVTREDCTLALAKELPHAIDETLLSSSVVHSGWGGLAPLVTNCSEPLIAPLVFNLESFHFSW